MTSNQLKFNLNAVVDTLNLVNLVHNPKPILIEKLGNNASANATYGRNSNYNNASKHQHQEFQVIDETKLSMYSFLVQRELKTKEWLNKYEIERFNEKTTNENKQPKKETMSKEVAFKSTHNPVKHGAVDSKASLSSKSNISSNYSAINTSTSTGKSTNDLNEVRKCCEDTIKSIENLLSQLNECKKKLNFLIFWSI